MGLIEPEDTLTAMQRLMLPGQIGKLPGGPLRQWLWKRLRPFWPLGDVNQPPEIRPSCLGYQIFNLRKPD